ncbi:DsbA family protein [Patescibacteria group bacterium]|nr:DsbA family protein [Patescibacteria group bacterium]MBU1705527.1 DsbA family protein [Patescibacteria group bacterium]
MPSGKNQPMADTPRAGQPVAGKITAKKIAIAMITVLVLALITIFVWRVLYFANLIRTGEINTLDFRYAGDQTTSLTALEGLGEAGADSLATEDDPNLGSRAAPVTIVEFSDFSCPYCRQSSFVMRSLVTRYGDQINFIFRDFPVSELHPQAQLAAQAANCAYKQNKFWEYHDKLFINQSRQQEEDLLRYARELNLDLGLFRICLTDREVAEEILDDFADGVAAGVYGTPTFFINGRRIPGAIPESIMEKMINGLLAK